MFSVNFVVWHTESDKYTLYKQDILNKHGLYRQDKDLEINSQEMNKNQTFL